MGFDNYVLEESAETTARTDDRRSIAVLPFDNRSAPKQLTAARKKFDLTPMEMARAMGVSYDTFKDWQSGRRGMPNRCVEMSPKTAQRLTEER